MIKYTKVHMVTVNFFCPFLIHYFYYWFRLLHWVLFQYYPILNSILLFLMFLLSAAARDIFNPFKACFNNNNGQNNLGFFCNMKQRKMFILKQL